MDFKPSYCLPQFQTLQEHAYARFLAEGLPTVKDEDWKYSDLNSVFKQTDQGIVVNKTALVELPLDFSKEYAQRWVFVNGVFSESLSDVRALKGLTVRLFSASSQKKDSAVELNTIAKPQGPQLLHLNTAMFQEGLSIELEHNITIQAPLQIIHLMSEDFKEAIYFRHFFHLKSYSQLKVMMYFGGNSTHHALMCPVLEVQLDEGAQLHHSHVQNEASTASHLAASYVQQQSHSYFNHQAVHVGAAFSRHDIETYLEGREAQCRLIGVYAPKNRQHHDTHTFIDHAVPQTVSVEEYRGILADHSRAVFNGKVMVRPGAVQINADQQNKNLLLSSDAEIDTKPQLEIYSDDVKCSHGATVGQLDEEALYYLRSRGIAEKEAKELLMMGFLGSILDQIEDESLKVFLKVLIQK